MMNKLRAVIVDDEPDAIKILRGLVEKHCKDVEIIAEAYTIKEAIIKIDQFTPDLLFLDVELSDGTGFDLLQKISDKNFETIFVTAHNHYSIKAFKFSAVDYLLKPVDVDEFRNAVDRAKNFHSHRSLNESHNYYDVLFENLNAASPKKFALPTSEGLEYVNIDDVILIKADGSYSELLFNSGKRKLVAKVLKDFHERLYEYGFFRSHNSFLVNLKHVKKLLKKDGGCIEMSDGSIASLSKRNVDLFKQIMKKYIYIS